MIKNPNSILSFCNKKSMSSDQTKTFMSILMENNNHYVGGNPGTGKSYLLNCLKEYLGNDLVITSTTGISAINVKGVTLHSFMHFFHTNMEFDILVNSICKRAGTKFRKLKYLVIEECSMCDGLIFSLLDYCLKKSRNNPKPFGGVKIILIGDFMQLPPVSNYGYLFETEAYEEGKFKIHLLTKSHRQTDNNFFELLNECRCGKLSKSSYEILQSKEIEDKIPRDICRIYSTNEEVRKWNQFKFDKIESKEHTYLANDFTVNSKFDTIFDKNSLIEKDLRLKVGAKVMLLRNLDFKKELINGSMGRVISCKPHYVTVEFDNGCVLDIQPELNEYMVDGEIVATREQIPLRLSWAISCHKIQGQTLDEAYIDLKRIFAPGQAYVALSRLRSLDGLYLKNLTKKAFLVDNRALEFYNTVEEK